MPENGSSAEQLADALFVLFAHLAQSSQQDVFQAVGELDLSVSQVRTLFLLNAFTEGGSDAPALHELAGPLGLSIAATGRAADALVRLGLLDRREDTADRRVKRVTLTRAGRELVERLSAARREDLRTFAGSLEEKERVLLSEALATILARPEFKNPKIGTSC